MACSKDVGDNSEKFPGGEGLDRYRAVVKNELQLFLRINYLRVRLSLRQTARMFLTTEENSGLESIGSCAENKMSEYARISCVEKFLKVYELLIEAWTSVIGMDMPAHMRTSYLDIRVQFHLNRSGNVNVNILAVSIFWTAYCWSDFRYGRWSSRRFIFKVIGYRHRYFDWPWEEYDGSRLQCCNVVPGRRKGRVYLNLVQRSSAQHRYSICVHKIGRQDVLRAAHCHHLVSTAQAEYFQRREIQSTMSVEYALRVDEWG